MEAFDLRVWTRFREAGGNTSSPAIVRQIALDSRRLLPDSLFVALPGKRTDGHNFLQEAANAGATFALVKSESCHGPIPSGMTLLHVKDTLQAFQEIVALYRESLPCQIIAITGSYGKTMVKDLVQQLLPIGALSVSPESFNSQIGVPLSLLSLTSHDRIALIEAGISEEGEMDHLIKLIQPSACILTPVGKKHLATLKSEEKAAQEYIKLAAAVSKEGWVLMPKSELFEPHLHRLSGSLFFWDDQQQVLPHVVVNKENRTYAISFEDKSCFTGKIPFGSSYFADYLNMGVKGAKLLGATKETIVAGLQRDPPQPNRTEMWRMPSKALLVNDTYSSDPQSIDRSLRFFDFTADGRRFFVFGGLRGASGQKESDYRRIGQALKGCKLDQLLCVGDFPRQQLLDCLSSYTKAIHFSQISEALLYLQKELKSGDLVLVKGQEKMALDQWLQVMHGGLVANQLQINLAAVESNMALIRSRLPQGARLMPMCKAEGYGTDGSIMAKFFEQCGIDILGLSYVDEAIALRRSGVSTSLFVINATAADADKVIAWDLEVALSDDETLEAFKERARAKEKKIKVHLHVDTGMSRLGCRPEEALWLGQKIARTSEFIFEGIMTHLVAAESPQEDSFTLSQVARFDHVVKELEQHNISPKWRHVQNSSGALRFSFPQYNMVRLGLSLYGFYPSEEIKQEWSLRPALTLTSKLVGLNHCFAQESVSYGRRYIVEKPRALIGVVPLGYFDGMHRHYSGKGEVLVKGYKVPLVGSVCMDFTMIDVTEVPGIKIGDSVLIFGEDEQGCINPAEQFAEKGSTIVYELMTCLGPRIPRIFIYEENQ